MEPDNGGLMAAARAVVTAAAAAVTVPALGAGTLLIRSVRGPEAAQRFAARQSARLLQRLGPAFVKVGQLVGTRRDLLPPVLVTELAPLQEAVRPLRPAQARRAFRREFGADLGSTFRHVDYAAVASGSIACVYRATLPCGRPVAVKLRRPGIARRMAADLTLIRAVARLAGRLPALRGIPVAAMVDRVCAAVHAQVDLEREGANLTQLGKHLAMVPAAVVPAVHPDVSSTGCLVMDFVPDLHLDALGDSGRLVRTRLAHSALDIIFEMLFVNGFVHCDLHPGNLYLHPDGRVTVLDAGFCVWLNEDTRWNFTQFFFNVGRGNGRRCAEVVIASAIGRRADADTERFTAGVVDLVRRTSRVPARDFSLVAFTGELFDLQRACGLYASPDFVFPLVSIMAVEGTLRDLDPGIDFQAAAMPALLQALAIRPT